MARPRSHFVCQACGAESPRWLGRCPECESWNSFVEESLPSRTDATLRHRQQAHVRPTQLSEVDWLEEKRLGTGMSELDRVLGGGIVPGSFLLVGGDPGIGKSTLLLQTADHLTRRGLKVLYVSGEESPAQIRLRAERLAISGIGLFLLAETDLQQIVAAVDHLQPDLLIVDSIQTIMTPELNSAPGSIGQVRECANQLMRLAKQQQIPVVLIGHVTKSGDLAGPKVLEHMVDCVLAFEGDHQQFHRMLRAVKNRFGPSGEVGLFQMEAGGLREVTQSSEFFLAERLPGVAGNVVVAAIEGTRPLLVELQALLVPAPFGTPRRVSHGIDQQKVSLIMAVLEKRAGLRLSGCDAYLKIAGGLKLNEPALDLGVAIALASSFTDQPADPSTVVFGEIGLGGELRSVYRCEQRVQEAFRQGFTRCIAPAANRRPEGLREMEWIGVRSVQEALEASWRGKG